MGRANGLLLAAAGALALAAARGGGGEARDALGAKITVSDAVRGPAGSLAGQRAGGVVAVDPLAAALGSVVFLNNGTTHATDPYTYLPIPCGYLEAENVTCTQCRWARAAGCAGDIARCTTLRPVPPAAVQLGRRRRVPVPVAAERQHAR
jgi:hypothetical protein